MNFFPGENTVEEIPSIPRRGPSPVVVIRDCEEDDRFDNNAEFDGEAGGVETVEDGAGWRQRLMAMDGIELPEFEDLDSLPAAGWDEETREVILSPWDASWAGEQSGPVASEPPTLDDPRQLWLNTEQGATADAGSEAMEDEKKRRGSNENIAISESQYIMSTEGLKPHSETAAIPPVQETKLWTGLVQPEQEVEAQSESEAAVIAKDEEWLAQSADVAFVAAILEDVPAPLVDPAAILEEDEAEVATAGTRGAGVKLAPGWKPLRGGTGADIGSGSDSDDSDVESKADETLNRVDPDGWDDSDMTVDAENEADTDMILDGESDEEVVAESKSVVRAPRHDSIVEGFGNFLNDSVVLDAAFTEPDFKALDPHELSSSIEVDSESVADIPDERETDADKSSAPALSEIDVPEALASAESDADAEIESDSIDVASGTAEDRLASPPSLSLEVVAPDEVDTDEVIPAAIVVPALIDGEEENDVEASELGLAGLSVLGMGAAAGLTTSLLDKLTDEASVGQESVDENEVDQCAALEDHGAQGPLSAMSGGFTSGNPALVRHGVSCPSCQQALRIQNRYLGIEGRCPGCAEMIVAKELASGLVIAELAEVETPKFFQQPDIEPEDVWGGTRLAAGGGPAAESKIHADDEAAVIDGAQGEVEPATEAECKKGSPLLLTADLREKECATTDSDCSESHEDLPVVPVRSTADPFSNPNRLQADRGKEADGIWGPGVGKPMS